MKWTLVLSYFVFVDGHAVPPGLFKTVEVPGYESRNACDVAAFAVSAGSSMSVHWDCIAIPEPPDAGPEVLNVVCDCEDGGIKPGNVGVCICDKAHRYRRR